VGVGGKYIEEVTTTKWGEGGVGCWKGQATKGGGTKCRGMGRDKERGKEQPK